jgi:hypothetical protein
MSYGGEEYEYEWPDDGGNEKGWSSGEGEGEDGEANPRIDVENMFYEADGNMKDKPKDAIE